MPPSSRMPDRLRKELSRLGTGEDEILVAEATDLDLQGNFAEEWLLASKNHIWIFSLTGNSPTVRWHEEISEGTEFEVSNTVGNGFLILKKNDVRFKILRYSNTFSGLFAGTSKDLSSLSTEEEISEPREDRGGRACPRCGTPFLRHSRICPKCMNKLKVLVRIFGYARKHVGVALGIAGVIVAGTALRFVPPYIVRTITDEVFVFPGGGAVSSRASLLFTLAVLLLLSHIVGTLLRILHGRLAATVGACMVFDFRAEAYSRLQYLSLGYYDKQQVGALMARITSDTEMIQHFVVDGIQYIFINILMLVFIAGMMFWQSPKLALLALITTPLVTFCTRFFIKKLHAMFHRYLDFRSRFHAVVNDALSGIRVVKAFAQEDWEIGRYQEKNSAYRDAGVGLERASSTYFPLLELISSMGGILVWVVGGYSVISSELTIGTFFLFVYLLGMLQGPLEGLSRMHIWISRTCAGAERVFEIIDAETEVKDPERPVVLNEIKGNIRFDNVTFGYDRFKPVLKHLDLEVASGEMIGLVGHSGAGKTTLINLVCRFYDPDEGRVLVDGTDLRDLRRRDYGKRLGVVLQESFLFNGTIYENIAYGRPDARPEDVLDAAIAANAHDFIMEKPDGYDSQAGEAGAFLSIGEKQRISIARAILHDPAVLILDEATASVDTETEQQIQEALARLVRNRTVFAIAHRLSTLQIADRLVVLKDGMITETGTHQELMFLDGEYARLVKMQSEMSKLKTVGG